VLARAKEWRNRFAETASAARRPVGELPPLEDVADLLVARLKARRTDIHRQVLDLLLANGTKRVDAFAPQVALSAMLGAGTPSVNQALIDMHTEWSSDEQTKQVLKGVADAVDAILDERGGAAGVGELVTEQVRRGGGG